MNKKIIKLQEKINLLQAELLILRESCPHENVTYKYGANTGNYDPSSDSYWVELWCKDCGKRNNLDQKDWNPYHLKEGDWGFVSAEKLK